MECGGCIRLTLLMTTGTGVGPSGIAAWRNQTHHRWPTGEGPLTAAAFVARITGCMVGRGDHGSYRLDHRCGTTMSCLPPWKNSRDSPPRCAGYVVFTKNNA